MKWTKAFRRNAGKEMTVDSTFEFEKTRNRPIKYNRELMGQTLRAMKRVSEVKDKRQDLFFKMRMRAHKGTQKAEIRAEIKKGIDIIAPAAANKEKAIAIATSKIMAQKQRAQDSKMKN
jgi:large subunit ribosomal protein L24e